MPAHPMCPEQQHYRRLLAGVYPNDEELARLVEHLETCAHCATTLNELRGSDQLAQALAAGSPQERQDQAEQQVVERLMERLVQLSSGGNTSIQGDQPVEPELDLASLLAPPQGDDEIGRLGGYRILQQLARGGMGVVVLAEDIKLGRRVALKVMKPTLLASPDARRRFESEARALAAVENEHIVPILHIGEERGTPFLVMPLLRGETLESRLRRESKLSPAEAVRIARGVAQGLAAAHARGLIHRDVKPANIWLEATDEPGTAASAGRVKILDFGLARQVVSDSGHTQPGLILGTPAYMSPEQARSETTDAPTDLFSLGCVLYRMTTGQEAFQGANALAILRAVESDQPRAPHEIDPRIPHRLSELILNLLAKAAADRLPTAVAVVEALDRPNLLLSAKESGANALTFIQEADPAPAPRQKSARRWLPLAVAAGLLLMASFTLAIIIQFRAPAGESVVTIETVDPDVEVVLKGNGKEFTLRDRKTKQEITLPVGKYEVELKGGKFGLKLETRQFTLKQGVRKLVRVTWAPGPPPVRPAEDVDRRVAEWVLKGGGKLVIHNEAGDREINSTRDLPAGSFQLSGITLQGEQGSPAGLAQFKDLARDLAGLRTLCVNSQALHATGVAHLKELTSLRALTLNGHGSSLNDAGLEYLQGLTRLTDLALENTPEINGAGLAHLKNLADLRGLRLTQTQANDAGLAHLKNFPRLQRLDLSLTPISDAGLVHLKGLRFLETLHLPSTRVSDAGLECLKELTNLAWLVLGNTQVSDTGLAHLKGLTNLTSLWLDGTQVSGRGLAQLKNLPKLDHLALAWTPLNDEGAKSLQDLTTLTFLHLEGALLGDAGLASLKNLTRLRTLNLGGTRITAAGLPHLKDLPDLKTLRLDRTQVTDAGVATLVQLRQLVELNVSRSRISARGFAALKEALPKTEIPWFEPNRTAALSVLDLGGHVHVRSKTQAEERLVKAAQELPDDYFRLTRANLAGVQKPFGDLLTKLALLTDPEFDHLQALDLSGLALGDDDLKTLQPLTGLRELVLTGTRVTDAGLAHLKSLQQLRRLVLDRTPLRGFGLGSLQDLPNLTELGLGCARVDDLFLGTVGELKKLERLSLAGSGVTDAGLKKLAGLTALQELDVTGTRVTPAGVAALQKLLPRCKVRAGATYDADRRATEWALAARGEVQIRLGAETREIRSVQDLPAVPFQLVSVRFTAALRSEVDDAGLARLKGLTHLKELYLWGGVSAAGLATLKDLKSLQVLNSDLDSLTNEGLAHLQGLTNLTALRFSSRRITDAGLEHLRGLTNLTQLELVVTPVDGSGLAFLKGCTRLRKLVLTGTQLNDAGLAHLKNLPRLEGLFLSQAKVSDAGLAHLQGLHQLRDLLLDGTLISNAGLKHLKGLTNLVGLVLDNTEVSDAGLVHLKDLPNLSSLWLNGTQVRGTGLAHLQGLPHLAALRLYRTPVDDEGIKHLKDLPALAFLNLDETLVGDAGLAHLKSLSKLDEVWLSGTRITDAGLAHLKEIPTLVALRLGATNITDAGLVHLKSMPQLLDLLLDRTRVTDAGMDILGNLPRLRVLSLKGARLSQRGALLLKAQRPELQLSWSEPNRTAATAILELGGSVQVRLQGQAEERVVKTAAVLPPEYFQLTRASLAQVQKPLGEVLRDLAFLTDPELDRLEALDLSTTSISDADLKQLKVITSLQELVLTETPITDVGLVHFRGLRKLRRLVLDRTRIRGDSLFILQDLPGLTELRLGSPTVTDISALAGLKHLERLSLAGSNITHEGLERLAGLTALRELDVAGTPITAVGVAALQKKLPKCKILSGPAAK